MAQSQSELTPDAVKRYDELISRHPDIARKGKNNPYTSLNGHMFSFLNKEGILALRMSKTDKAAFEEKYNSPPMISYNTVMKEYVSVPEELFSDLDLLDSYVRMSHDYVASLKPKPSKKKK